MFASWLANGMALSLKGLFINESFFAFAGPLDISSVLNFKFETISQNTSQDHFLGIDIVSISLSFLNVCRRSLAATMHEGPSIKYVVSVGGGGGRGG